MSPHPVSCDPSDVESEEWVDDLDRMIDRLSSRDPGFVAGLDDIAYRQRLIRQLIQRRNTLGLTQAAVAEQMGTTQSSVSGLENGDGDVFLSTLQRYSRAVDCRLEVVVCTPVDASVDPSKVQTLRVDRKNRRSLEPERAERWKRSLVS